MSRPKYKDSFWTGYSDLMTSLFFVTLVLFIICFVRMSSMISGGDYEELRCENDSLKIVNNELKDENIALINEIDRLKYEIDRLKRINVELVGQVGELTTTAENLQNILSLETQFEELSKSSSLRYDQDKRMFYSKDFEGIEIFYPFNGNNFSQATKIKPEYLPTINKVGADLADILKRLYQKNQNFKYQLVIEGTAAIPYKHKKAKTFNPDNALMYELSYKRALALYNIWKNLNLRQYNTEIIIAGSGFNGINRDEFIEDNNKRFTIQIIPKVSPPKDITL